MGEEKISDIEPGFIYLIEATGVFKPGTIRCKLGKSIDKEERLRQLLRSQPCTTYRMTDSLLCNNITKTEKLFHQRYRQYNANIPGSREWFDFPPEVLAQVKADFRELEKNRIWTPLPPLVDPKSLAPDENVNLSPVQFLNLNQHLEPLNQSQSQPENQQNPTQQVAEPRPSQAQSVENLNQNQSPNQESNPSRSPDPNAVEAEIVDEEEYISAQPVTESSHVQNVFIFMNDLDRIGQISRSRKTKNFVGGLVMTAFLGLLAVGSLFQGSSSVPASLSVGETINAGLSAAQNNDPNQARELFRNLQNINSKCEAKLGESLVLAVEQAKSSDEFYELANKPLRVANEQGCIKLR